MYKPSSVARFHALWRKKELAQAPLASVYKPSSVARIHLLWRKKDLFQSLRKTFHVPLDVGSTCSVESYPVVWLDLWVVILGPSCPMDDI